MEQAKRYIQSLTAVKPGVGIVLGSGLGEFANSLGNAIRVPYSEIPDMPASTAAGHAGELVIGSVQQDSSRSADIAVMSGRFHLYEGYSPRQVTSGIRLLHELGVKTLVLTNAAGGINSAYGEGALVLISDHINLQGVNPLVGANDDRIGPRFPDMTEAYSLELRRMAHETARELGIKLHEGVYGGVLGPSYETPAEIHFLRTIGADLVGMSTVAEAIAANHMGMRVLGISCVSNLAAGLSGHKLMHEEVLATGHRVAGTFLKLLKGLISRLAE
jgi:purine-nucleoside phosphorylase